MRVFRSRHLFQPGGWLSPGIVRVDERGIITAIEDGADGSGTPGDFGNESVIELDGWVVPGMANVHSHAFQRALVGLGERAAPGRSDSFWTWREAMYQLALGLSPDDLEAIAAQLYVEMLEAGMTAVGEFHYLHHERDGARYADAAETSQRIIQAAGQAGIGLTLLPVLYLHGGFERPPSPEQRRFVHRDLDDFLATLDAIQLPEGAAGRVRLGVAPHSLRAVDGPSLEALVATVRQRDARAPIHIHIAEQTREVDEAIAHLGARPVRWLLDNVEVDPGFCLVHATHVEPDELSDLARTRAVAGLCPTTEANLGDGVFPAPEFVAQGGRFALGSDSHASVSVGDELRTLEYGQRLRHRRRNLLVGPDLAQAHVGRFLFESALAGGAQAVDQPMGALAPGRRADLVMLDPDHPRLVGHGGDTVLDAWILGAAEGAVRHVYAAGEEIVRGGVHRAREPVFRRFRQVMERLGHVRTRGGRP